LGKKQFRLPAFKIAGRHRQNTDPDPRPLRQAFRVSDVFVHILRVNPIRQPYPESLGIHGVFIRFVCKNFNNAKRALLSRYRIYTANRNVVFP
jgi:hypothetical protein